MTTDYSEYSKSVLIALKRLELDEKIRGNLIPDQFYHVLLDGYGRCNYLAVIVLSDLLYWYRPKTIHRDDGQLELTTKYTGHLLQKSRTELATKFNVTTDQIDHALDYLRAQGWIETEILQAVKIGKRNSVWNNVLYFKINVEKIESLLREDASDAPVRVSVVYNHEKADALSSNSDTLSERPSTNSETALGKLSQKVVDFTNTLSENPKANSETYTETTTESSTKTQQKLKKLHQQTTSTYDEKKPIYGGGGGIECGRFLRDLRDLKDMGIEDDDEESSLIDIEREKEDALIIENLKTHALSINPNLYMGDLIKSINTILCQSDLLPDEQKLWLSFSALTGYMEVKPEESVKKWSTVIMAWHRESHVTSVDIANAVAFARIDTQGSNIPWHKKLFTPYAYNGRVQSAAESRIKSGKPNCTLSPVELYELSNKEPNQVLVIDQPQPVVDVAISSSLLAYAKSIDPEVQEEMVLTAIYEIAPIKKLRKDEQELLVAFCILSKNYLIKKDDLERKWIDIATQWSRMGVKPVDIATSVLSARYDKKEGTQSWYELLHTPHSYNTRVNNALSSRINDKFSPKSFPVTDLLKLAWKDLGNRKSVHDIEWKRRDVHDIERKRKI